LCSVGYRDRRDGDEDTRTIKRVHTLHVLMRVIARLFQYVESREHEGGLFPVHKSGNRFT
jgi:hypothetical protein